MSKKSIEQKRTRVQAPDTVGEQEVNVFTVDDSILPPPQELEAYKQIDPEIIKYLMDAAAKEQEHRHKTTAEKIYIIKDNQKKEFKINLLGIICALISVIAILCLCAWALYLDKQWISTIIGISTIVSLASIFINNQKKKN